MLQIKRITTSAIIPTRANESDAGLDLYADRDVLLPSGIPTMISTGIAMSIPEGFEAQVRSRSGLAGKNGIFVLNSPGTIDCTYRGEVKVILFNTGVPYQIKYGDRIAQMVINAIKLWTPIIVDELSKTVRDSAGFGSTGK